MQVTSDEHNSIWLQFAPRYRAQMVKPASPKRHVALIFQTQSLQRIDCPSTGRLQLLNTWQRAATQANPVPCTPAKGSPSHLVPAPSSFSSPSIAKEPTSPDQGLQGSTGMRKVGRKSKHVWEIQMEEERLGVKWGMRTVTWELQVFDLYNSLTKYMSLSLTCSKVPFSHFSKTVLNVM